MEQVADVIMQIENTDDRSRKLLAIVKNRVGREGKVAFEFEGQGTRWKSAGDSKCPLDDIIGNVPLDLSEVDDDDEIPF